MKRAVELSAEKYCSASIMLGAAGNMSATATRWWSSIGELNAVTAARHDLRYQRHGVLYRPREICATALSALSPWRCSSSSIFAESGATCGRLRAAISGGP